MPPVQTQIEILKVVAESGQSALKALLLLNGGAAIAFLAFLGAAFKGSGVGPEQAAAFGFVMRCFLVGAFFSVCASGTTYLSNLIQSLGGHWPGIAVLVFTVILGIVSLGAFSVGGWAAADAFAITSPPAPCGS